MTSVIGFERPAALGSLVAPRLNRLDPTTRGLRCSISPVGRALYDCVSRMVATPSAAGGKTQVSSGGLWFDYDAATWVAFPASRFPIGDKDFTVEYRFVQTGAQFGWARLFDVGAGGGGTGGWDVEASGGGGFNFVFWNGGSFTTITIAAATYGVPQHVIVTYKSDGTGGKYWVDGVGPTTHSGVATAFSGSYGVFGSLSTNTGGNTPAGVGILMLNTWDRVLSDGEVRGRYRRPRGLYI